MGSYHFWSIILFLIHHFKHHKVFWEGHKIKKKIFTVDLTLCSKCQIDGKDFVKFCGLLGKYELWYVFEDLKKFSLRKNFNPVWPCSTLCGSLRDLVSWEMNSEHHYTTYEYKPTNGWGIRSFKTFRVLILYIYNVIFFSNV